MKVATIEKIFFTSEHPLMELVQELHRKFSVSSLYAMSYPQRIDTRNFDYYCYITIFDTEKINDAQNEINHKMESIRSIERFHWEV